MMSAELQTTWMDIGPSSVCTVVRASFMSHRSYGTASESSGVLSPRRPRSKAITPGTCPASPNALNFSLIDTSLTTTFETAQNAPESRGVEQSAERRLENAEKVTEHAHSKSMTLEFALSDFQVVHDHAYSSHSTQEVIARKSISTAITREPDSCRPQEGASHEEEQGYFSGETRHDAMDANSLASPFKAEWDVARDNETLRHFSYNPLNLVLDSMSPHIAPHIVVTPAEETWEDEYVPWQNRVNPQWPCHLCVPPLDFSTGRMLVVGPHPYQPLLETHPDSLPSNANQVPLVASDSVRHVLRSSTFTHSVCDDDQNEIDSFCSPVTSHECEVLTEEMMTIQKALCKATFFAASDVARAWRKRYISQPNLLSTLDPAFMWTDPAEPILIANRRMLGATILDSFCPFLAPHIIINSPPPQPYQLTENNSTPYTQDAAFGDRLVVEAYYTNIINEVDGSEHNSSYASSTYTIDNWEDTSNDSSMADLLESDIESRPGSPLPETPIDGDDDRYFYFVENDNEELEEDDLAIHCGYQSIYGVNSFIGTTLCTDKLQSAPRSMFYIEEDDDELPSLDDW